MGAKDQGPAGLLREPMSELENRLFTDKTRLAWDAFFTKLFDGIGKVLFCAFADQSEQLTTSHRQDTGRKRPGPDTLGSSIGSMTARISKR
jgi:hypothetical protein